MAATVTIEVARYRPGRDAEPTRQAFEVPLRQEWVVLDALTHIKDEIDGSVSFRWSCRMGVCGSCGMMVDGQPTLTCAAYLADHLPGPIRVEPLRHFPVIRDLVVDLTGFLGKLARVRPWIVRPDAPAAPDAEYRQTPRELARYHQFSQCINCLLCYAACPIVGLEPDFVGPAAIALAQRYNLDSRDQGARERLEILSGDHGIWDCTFVGECSVVCPKNVDPAGAIQQYKLSSAMDALRWLVLPWGRR
jgi:fumarate reductase iron-sulfur subunit